MIVETKIIEQELFNRLKVRDENTIKEEYNRYRQTFSLFIKKYFKFDDDTIKDLYQEVWYTFFQNIKSGSLQVLTSSIKTYLFQIGRNQALVVLRRTGKFSDVTSGQTISELESKGYLSVETASQNISGLKSVYEPWEDNKQMRVLSGSEDKHRKKLSIVKKVVESMTKACRSILIPFYFENKNLDEILSSLSKYNTKNALKTQKYKCMKSMEKQLKEKFKTAELY